MGCKNWLGKIETRHILDRGHAGWGIYKMNQEIKHRLLFILHRGLAEARLLAQAKKHDQLFDFADNFEPIPAYMDNWQDSHLEAIRLNLKTYRSKYPNPAFDYLRYLDKPTSVLTIDTNVLRSTKIDPFLFSKSYSQGQRMSYPPCDHRHVK